MFKIPSEQVSILGLFTPQECLQATFCVFFHLPVPVLILKALGH